MSDYIRDSLLMEMVLDGEIEEMKIVATTLPPLPNGQKRQTGKRRYSPYLVDRLIFRGKKLRECTYSPSGKLRLCCSKNELERLRKAVSALTSNGRPSKASPPLSRLIMT